MRFSAKSEYAVTAVLDMALNTEKGPVHVRAIARRHSIPVRFLEQVMASLKKAGLVESIRGAQGGYVLSRDSGLINLSQIVEAIEGPINTLDNATGTSEYRRLRITGLVVREAWEEVRRGIINVLSGITIEEMCRRTREQTNTVMYHI